MLVLGNLKDTEISRLSENTLKPVPFPTYDPFVAYFLKTKSTAHSDVDEILILKSVENHIYEPNNALRIQHFHTSIR